jgi:hypothetical protein
MGEIFHIYYLKGQIGITHQRMENLYNSTTFRPNENETGVVLNSHVAPFKRMKLRGTSEEVPLLAVQVRP